MSSLSMLRYICLVLLAVSHLVIWVSCDKTHVVTPFTEMFGDTLYQWSNSSRTEIHEMDTVDLLKNKDTVAIYYSASWCGPCKQFTPILAQFYTDMKKKGKKFEIVLVSRDKTPEDFVSYYQHMPWLAVTLGNADSCFQATAAKFGIKGIPYLVVLDGYDASVYTVDGREKVLNDQYGLEFPWQPRTPAVLLKRLVPRPLRGLVAQQLGSAKGKLVQALVSLLKSVAPGRLLLKLLSIN